ncbi:hypothetical protein AB0K02_20970 [Streptomyces sp. NPDC049597]|uniref:hypothetical protein n=1 Tax=Streptomyces sp. NPDC049597 TaxID=3155276 RepID=UPI003424E658
MSADTHQAPGRHRSLRTAGLTGMLLFMALAAVLWLVADAFATRKCFDGGYGLGDSVSMTEEGCEVTVRTADGARSAVLPTLDEPIATAALIAGLAGAVPPGICLWLATRRTR